VTEVIQAASELQAVCQAHGWQFCFIGGLALQRWGEPRETIDADLTLLAGYGEEQPFVEVLLRHFEGRIPDAAQFACERRVLLLRSRSGVGLDVSLGGLPFEALAVERSSFFEYPPKVLLRTCSAEDLVVMKSFAGRGQDWVDVERIIVRQMGKLDWDYIYTQLRPLLELKEAPENLDSLKRLRATFER
jgi:hypothetical protein